jgi:hypothetical protein
MGDQLTPIKRDKNLASVPVDPSAQFAQPPDVNPSVLNPGIIPVPSGPSQGQERFAQPLVQQPSDNKFSFFKKDFGLKNFDIKSLLIIFLLLVAVSSSYLVNGFRKFIPNALDSEGLLTPVTSMIVGIVGCIIYFAVFVFKNS